MSIHLWHSYCSFWWCVLLGLQLSAFIFEKLYTPLDNDNTVWCSWQRRRNTAEGKSIHTITFKPHSLSNHTCTYDSWDQATHSTLYTYSQHTILWGSPIAMPHSIYLCHCLNTWDAVINSTHIQYIQYTGSTNMHRGTCIANRLERNKQELTRLKVT